MTTFWTIQNLAKWKEFESTGLLQATPGRLWMVSDCSMPGWPVRWTACFRNHAPPGVSLPVWAWYRYGPERRPDLRAAGYLARGTKGVRIEFSETLSRVLLTDFLRWHNPLNSACVRKDWEKIIIHPGQTRRLQATVVQATLWELRLHQVKAVTHFTAR